jgi:hypothetical protein
VCSLHYVDFNGGRGMVDIVTATKFVAKARCREKNIVWEVGFGRHCLVLSSFQMYAVLVFLSKLSF